jgi:hypothetical protein
VVPGSASATGPVTFLDVVLEPSGPNKPFIGLIAFFFSDQSRIYCRPSRQHNCLPPALSLTNPCAHDTPQRCWAAARP